LNSAHLAEHFYIYFVESLMVGRENGDETCERSYTSYVYKLGLASLPLSMKLQLYSIYCTFWIQFT